MFAVRFRHYRPEHRSGVASGLPGLMRTGAPQETKHAYSRSSSSTWTLHMKSSFRKMQYSNPSPTGRGLGEGLKICRHLDPHPTPLNLDFTYKTSSIADLISSFTCQRTGVSLTVLTGLYQNIHECR